MAKSTSSACVPLVNTRWKLLTPIQRMLLHELLNDEGADALLCEELLAKYELADSPVISWVDEMLLSPDNLIDLHKCG